MMFKLKGSEGAIEDVYALLHKFLTQLEVYQPVTLGMVIQSHSMEELVVSLFLNSIQSSISSHIKGAILSGGY